MEGAAPNDFDFRHGMNSKYGFIMSSNGEAMPGITISNGTSETTTNDDGKPAAVLTFFFPPAFWDSRPPPGGRDSAHRAGACGLPGRLSSHVFF